MGRMPDFLIIGAARAGTTAIYSYLRQHDRVFMPDGKEPNFFAYEGSPLDARGPGADYVNNSISTLADYHALFENAANNALIGEASPLYLYSDIAPANIKRHAPKARMIVILRNPVEQAFSHFMYGTKECIEPEPDFTKALEYEEQRLADRWQPMFQYSAFPRYGEQLARYFEIFPKEQFYIRTYEDFQNDPENMLTEMFEFIGADPEFHPDMSIKPNAGGVPKNQVFQNFLMKSNPVTRAIGLVVPQEQRLKIRDRLSRLNLNRKAQDQIPEEARQILHQRLDDDVTRLERLIDRDLSAWKSDH